MLPTQYSGHRSAMLATNSCTMLASAWQAACQKGHCKVQHAHHDTQCSQHRSAMFATTCTVSSHKFTSTVHGRLLTALSTVLLSRSRPHKGTGGP
jgi:hypothetical protein